MCSVNFLKDKDFFLTAFYTFFIYAGILKTRRESCRGEFVLNAQKDEQHVKRVKNLKCFEHRKGRLCLFWMPAEI